jgi:hypothetical protein
MWQTERDLLNKYISSQDRNHKSIHKSSYRTLNYRLAVDYSHRVAQFQFFPRCLQVWKIEIFLSLDKMLQA